MDNVLTSIDTNDGVQKFFSESRNLLSDAGFNLRSWASNNTDLQETAKKEEVLDLKSYSSYSAEKEHNGGFTFSSLCVDYIVPFLSIYYNEKNGKNALDWYDLKTGDKVEVIDDVDDCWIFSDRNI